MVSKYLRLDLLFRFAILAWFVYMVIAGLRMPRTSFGNPGLYPVFVGCLGLLFWAGLHVQGLLRRGRRTGGGARIYDIAYEFGDIPAHVIRQRTLLVFGMLGGLMLGAWLLSFHIAVPVFLYIALRRLGKASWPLALTWIVVLELLLVVVFGEIAHVAWPRTALEVALGVSFQSLLGAPFHALLAL
jgi:hypothetical protein